MTRGGRDAIWSGTKTRQHEDAPQEAFRHITCRFREHNVHLFYQVGSGGSMQLLRHHQKAAQPAGPTQIFSFCCFCIFRPWGIHRRAATTQALPLAQLVPSASDLLSRRSHFISDRFCQLARLGCNDPSDPGRSCVRHRQSVLSSNKTRTPAKTQHIRIRGRRSIPSAA